MSQSHSTQLVVSDVGGTLLLKLYGFVQDQAAEIRDVTENSLTMRLGRSWLQRCLWGDRHPYRLDVAIEFIALPDHSRRHTVSQVTVQIRDAQWLPKPELFEMAVRQLMWQLRSSLMVV